MYSRAIFFQIPIFSALIINLFKGITVSRQRCDQNFVAHEKSLKRFFARQVYIIIFNALDIVEYIRSKVSFSYFAYLTLVLKVKHVFNTDTAFL
jgi:hypothetical protein